LTTNGKLLPRRGVDTPVSRSGALSAELGGLDHRPTDAANAAAPHNPDPLSGAELVERLFRSQAPQLLRFLSRRTARPDDAADMLQEAFLRLTKLFALGSHPDRPEAYLQQIVSNLLRDGSRRRASRSDALHGPLDAQPIVDPAPGPSDHLEARQMLHAYEACLMRLRPKTRMIFLLHRREGLTYAQIAAEAGLSVSGVEKHMMKAIAHIDREIGRPW
jgi:RNA polymerase sigma factor (sigma-70 family)